jgi:hypothetical protein
VLPMMKIHWQNTFTHPGTEMRDQQKIWSDDLREMKLKILESFDTW